MADPKKIVETSIRFPIQVHDKLRRESFERRESINAIVVEAVEAALQTQACDDDDVSADLPLAR